MKNKKTILIVLFAVLIISNGFLLYLVFHDGRSDMKDSRMPEQRGMPKFTEITDEQKAEVTSLFSGTINSEEINSYCSENMMNCAYYCMNVDSTNSFCSELNQRRQSLPQQ